MALSYIWDEDDENDNDDDDQEISPELLARLEELSKEEPTYDEDCPELTEKQYKMLRCAVLQRNRTLRNMREAEEKAKKTKEDDDKVNKINSILD